MGYIPVTLALLGFSLLVILVNVNAVKKSKEGLLQTLALLRDILGVDFQDNPAHFPSPSAVQEKVKNGLAADASEKELKKVKEAVNAYKNLYQDYSTQISGAPTKWIAPMFGYQPLT